MPDRIAPPAPPSEDVHAPHTVSAASADAAAPPRAAGLPSLDELFPQLEDELRRIAHRHRRRQVPHDTLSTTAVVNEAYIRMKAAARLAPEDRLHFLALAARAMRFVLVDYARRWSRSKRGGAQRPAVLDDDVFVASAASAEATLDLDRALERLAAHSARMGRIVECRFFGGMTEVEIAEVLGVSERTVRGEWQRAKLWLARELAAPSVRTEADA
jgi:RNA polymerase sigma factor (TIGR02999 family)